MTAPQRRPPANFVRSWLPLAPGDLVSHNPARPDEVVWQGTSHPDHAGQAGDAARAAQPTWGTFPLERRIEALRAFQRIARERVEEAAALICDETGKALWDAHRRRTLAALARLRSGIPTPRLAARDPLALRFLVMLLFVVGFVVAGPERIARLGEAFRGGETTAAAIARIDAWVT
ncbi:MAG: aldehyde dehydrogenase family protein, partial [Phycisphaerales bacterium]|nr:aldehyde dehydrogenase family protein [Phycisphaerales bacterium]